MEHERHRLGAADWCADVAVAILRVHQAPGSSEPRWLVGSQNGLVDASAFCKRVPLADILT